MDNKQIKLRVTLEIDDKWASNLSKDELAETIKVRLNNSLGFRGRVKRLSVLSPKVASVMLLLTMLSLVAVSP